MDWEGWKNKTRGEILEYMAFKVLETPSKDLKKTWQNYESECRKHLGTASNAVAMDEVGSLAFSENQPSELLEILRNFGYIGDWGCGYLPLDDPQNTYDILHLCAFKAVSKSLESFWRDLVCKRKTLEQKLKKGEQ